MSSRTRNAASRGTLDLPADDEQPSAPKQGKGPLAGLTEPEPEARARAAALQSSLARGRASVNAFAAALAAHRPPAAAASALSARKLGRARVAPAEPAGTSSSTSAAPSTPAAPGTPWAPGPSRQYPVAWALWGRGTQTSGASSADDAHARARPADPTTTTQAVPPPPTELAVRPPPGRPTVRGAVRTRPAPTAVPASTLLAETTDAALLVASPDGAQSMQLSIRDDVFAQLQCNIEVGPQGVVATFYAQDVNTRRLLAAESDALRLRLEARGLSVAAVRVAAAGEAPAVPAAWAQVVAPAPS